jgi:hypothetical protein
MKFSQFVEGFLGLQGASNAWGGRGGGLSSNARGVVQHAPPRPGHNHAAVVAAAQSLAAALRDAKRIAASTAVRTVAATPLPAPPKPAIMQAAPAPPPPGPAEPEVPPVVEIVAEAPPPPPEAYAPAPAADSYAPSGEFNIAWLNSWRATVGAGPFSIDPALLANARFTSSLAEHQHNLGDRADGQVLMPSFNERCTNQMLQAAGFPAYGQVETSLRVYICERAELAGMDCPKFLRAIRMDTAGRTIHFDIVSDPAFRFIACFCSNHDNGGVCTQDEKCTCDVQRG